MITSVSVKLPSAASCDLENLALFGQIKERKRWCSSYLVLFVVIIIIQCLACECAEDELL